MVDVCLSLCPLSSSLPLTPLPPEEALELDAPDAEVVLKLRSRGEEVMFGFRAAAAGTAAAVLSSTSALSGFGQEAESVLLC